MAQEERKSGGEGWVTTTTKKLRNHSNYSLASRRVLGETLILDCRETVNTNF